MSHSVVRGFISLTLLILAGAPANVFCQGSLIIADRDFSGVAGAEDLLTCHRALTIIEGRCLPPRWVAESSPPGRLAGLGYRMTLLALVDMPLAGLTHLVGHEVFGHGARARESELTELSYEIHPDWPYGDGHGLTRWNLSPGRTYTASEWIQSLTGGVETSGYMSHRIRMNWLGRRAIPYTSAALYLRTVSDLPAYIARTRDDPQANDPGNDITSYIMALNRYEGYPDPAAFPLTISHLKKQALVHALDPYAWLSAGTLLKYIWSGEGETSLPMITVYGGRGGATHWLPALGLALTPFGSEYRLDNLFVRSGRPMCLRLRAGDRTFHTFWGVGIGGLPLLGRQSFSLSGDIDLWHQPGLSLGGSRLRMTRSGVGGAARLGFCLRSATVGRGSLFMQAGYKTTGFLEAEPLDQGFIFRAGTSVDL